MLFLNGTIQSPGAVTTAKNGTAVKSVVGGQVALTVSVQINFTGSSESGATAQLQKSNDGVQWNNDGSTVAISGASGTQWLEKQYNTATYWRVQYAISTGSYTPTEIWNFIG